MSPDSEQNSEQEFIKHAVKLLFQRVQAGKVTIAPHLIAQFGPALEAVKFDHAGEPLLETVQPQVVSLAKAAAWAEEMKLRDEEKDREEKSEIHGSLPQRVDVSETLLTEKAKTGAFDELAFELFKETACVLIVCVSCHIAVDEPTEFVFKRNQAICAGLLVRIVKFMRAIMAILTHGDTLGEVVLALLRCIGESAINARFLILKNDDVLFDRFVNVSLGPERELYDTIEEAVRKRGGGDYLPIEMRMRAVIERLCKTSGVKIEEVNRKHVEWGGTMRDRLIALGAEAAYAGVQRIPSHAIHGTWVDLILHHLEEKPGGFATKLEQKPIDPRYLVPISVFVLSAANDYLKRFIGDTPEVRPLISRIDDLEDRLRQVNEAHEVWYSQTKKTEPPAPLTSEP